MSEAEPIAERQQRASHWRTRVALCAVLVLGAGNAGAQLTAADPVAAAASAAADSAAAAQSADNDALRELVAPVALYPDDLLAVALPASTQPVDIVQAARFLEKHASDSSLEPNPDWDPAVLALINYADVIVMMNTDLDWTTALGNAVVDDQDAVMDAIQQLRAEAYGAGYLQSNEQQVVVQEQQVIYIQPADPEIIYVPRYDPQVIVVRSYAVPVVYSTPYPYYYSPAATFFAGAVVGAAFAYRLSWRHRSIDINRNVNVNRNVTNNNVNIGARGDRPGTRAAGLDDKRFSADRRANGDGSSMTWNARKATANQPAQRQRQAAGSGHRAPGAAPGRPSTRPGNGASTRPGNAQGGRPSAGNAPRAGDRAASGRQGASVGNYQNGRTATNNSQRGNRSAQSSQRTRSAPQRNTQSSSGRSSGGAFGGNHNGQRAQRNSNRGNRSARSGGGGRRSGGGRR